MAASGGTEATSDTQAATAGDGPALNAGSDKAGVVVKIRLPLQTDRLIVRPLRQEDADDLHELYSDAEGLRFLTDDAAETVDQSRAWVRTKMDLFDREGGMSLWAVVEREGGRVVGDAGLQWEEIEGRRELDLGCRIAPSRRGRGYATQASTAILRAAFAAGFHRLTAQTDVDNAAARRVLERLGFRANGTTDWCGHTMAVYLCLHPGMSVGDVLEVLGALDGLRLWLDGGWGVDALLGEQTRPHRDLDLSLDERDLPAAEGRLRALGYEEVEEGWVGRPTRVVFADGRGRRLDVHPLRFDEAGDGRQLLPDGGVGSYPGPELVSGTIAGRTAPCISASLQLAHHRGYTLAPHDRADLHRLRERRSARDRDRTSRNPHGAASLQEARQARP